MVERAALNRLVLVQVQVPQLFGDAKRFGTIDRPRFFIKGAACFHVKPR